MSGFTFSLHFEREINPLNATHDGRAVGRRCRWGVAAAGCSSPEAPERGRPEEGDASPPWGHPEADRRMTKI
ncbi:hypothetical protein [Infirmifilum sp. NZ]|uniref:hypothetical protein n=1 Tax=Infirmifilum sp. NZ TaxID=2926850 RepID=UPI0027AB6788|nr:hypothetical protein [Infirmifilum sp. NZ]UNQ73360.1 hypothetical protein MOV14_09640 [Infirmifilum sp. NZ]